MIGDLAEMRCDVLKEVKVVTNWIADVECSKYIRAYFYK